MPLNLFGSYVFLELMVEVWSNSYFSCVESMHEFSQPSCLVLSINFLNLLILMSYFTILMYRRFVNFSKFDDCMVCYSIGILFLALASPYEMLVNRSEVSLLDLDEYMSSPGL